MTRRAIGFRGVLVGVVVGSGLSWAPLAVGQQVLAELKLSGPFGGIGDAVGSLGDISGDGVPELLVAGPVGTFVKSGADGTTLAFASNGFETPFAVDSAGDLDGDGTADFVTATTVTIRACSGADGSLLWSAPAGTGSNFTADVEALDDVSGDGVPDVAVSESQVQSDPQLRVFSGVDGSVLYQESFTAFSMDSVEWDGTPGLELVVGDPDFSQHGNNTGRVRVLEPMGGAVLATFTVTQAGAHIGRSVASLGDVNGDGVPDIIGSTGFIQGVTTVWSGLDGSVLYGLPSTFFFHIERVGDVTGDGKADFVGGGPGGGTGGFGSGTLRNGATGALIKQLAIVELTAFRTFEGTGDVDGDGLPDLLVSSSGGGFSGSNPSARLFALPAGTQIQLISNPAGGSNLGSSIDLAGDLDGDGQGDFVLASTDGAVVFSADGEVLLQIAAPATSIFGAGSTQVAAPGDVNGDGVPDIAIGQGYNGGSFNGRVALYSGADGSQLAAVGGTAGLDLGLDLVAVPDRNGDGVRDLFVSAPGMEIKGLDNVGEVRLLSGANLSPLMAFHGDEQSNEVFGWTLDAGGDYDHDGVVDLAVGGQGGTMYVVSGATGAELERFIAHASSPDIFGSLVGDADGDGHEDVLVREPYFFTSPVPPIEPPGRVRLVSGDGGALLWEHVGFVANGMLGLHADGAGDVDGDGFADVAYTERSDDVGASSGTVWIRSGATGAVLDQYALPPQAGLNQMGAALSAGYVDAGGCNDVIVGVPALDNNGGAHILASSEGGVHGFVDLGFGKPGTDGFTPELRGYGNLAAGGQVTIKVRDIKPFTTGAWFIGISQGNLPFKQGVLVPSPLGPFFQFLVGSGPIGQFTFTGTNSGAVFAGLSIYHQFWFVDGAATAGVSASNGMKEIFK